MTRTIEYKPRASRTGQPLTLVECTGCGCCFTSAARSHTNCPDCGRNLRVNRAPKRRAPVQDRIVNAPSVRQESRPVRKPLPFPLIPVSVSAPVPPAASRLADPDDDGETYVIERGLVVLGTWESGRVVPAATLPASYLAAQLAARGWHRQAHGRDICQVVRAWPAVADVPPALEPCQRPAARGVLCEKCFAMLRIPA